MSVLKNPQFKSNQADIPRLLRTHVVVILTKFRKGWAKLVDLSLKAIFWSCPLFYGTPSRLNFLEEKKIKFSETFFLFPPSVHTFNT